MSSGKEEEHKKKREMLGQYLTNFERALIKFITQPEKGISINETLDLLFLEKVSRNSNSLEEDREEIKTKLSSIRKTFNAINNFADLLKNNSEIIWVTHALWDDSIDDFYLISTWFKEDSGPKKRRYNFIQKVIQDSDFQSHFPEPMSELMFKTESSPKIICLEWPRNSQEMHNECSQDICYIINELGVEINGVYDQINEEFNALWDEIEKSIESNEEKNKQWLKGDYAPTKDDIAALIHGLNNIVANVIPGKNSEIEGTSQGNRVLEVAEEKVNGLIKHLGVEIKELSGQKNKENISELIVKSMIWNRLFDQDWQALYYIPALLQDKVPISGAVVASEKPLKDELLLALSCAVSRLFAAFHFSMYSKQIEHQAKKAAAAGIISRNMSHNIGSHVIPRVGMMRLENWLNKLFHDKLKWALVDKKSAILFMLNELTTKLDRYFQRKADFIAETTTSPLMSTRTASFYQEVLMPFVSNTALIDTIAKNENFGYRIPDKINDRDYDESWPASIRFRFFSIDESCQDTKNNQYQLIEPLYFIEHKLTKQRRALKCDAAPYVSRNINDPETFGIVPAGLKNTHAAASDPPTAQDWAVALPGPNGEFAIYAILENIIRNSAKHNSNLSREQEENNRDLELWVGLRNKKDDESFYYLEIYDTLTTGKILNAELTTSEKQSAKTLKDKLNLLLGESIIQKNGAIRSEAWGIAEIMICSALLMGSVEYQLPKSSPRCEILSDRLPDELINGRTNAMSGDCLVYRFPVMKPRHVILIGEALLALIPGVDRKSLNRSGIWHYRSWDDFCLESSRAKVGPQFALISDQIFEKMSAEKQDQFVKKMPFRAIIINSKKGGGIGEEGKKRTEKGFIGITQTQLGASETPEKFIEKLWQIWLSRWIDTRESGPKANLHIFLGSTGSKDWGTHARVFNESCKGLGYQLSFYPEKKEMASEESAFNIIYDRHGSLLEADLKAKAAKTKKANSTKKKTDRYTAVDKHSMDFDRLYNPSFPSSDQTPWLLPYQLIEAGMLKILIVDERIAERAMESISDTKLNSELLKEKLTGTKNKRGRYWHIAEQAGVLICTHIAVKTESNSDATKTKKNSDAEAIALHSMSWDQAQKESKDSAGLVCPKLELKLTFPSTAEKGQVDLSAKRSINKGKGDDEITHDIDVIVIHQGAIDNMAKIMNYRISKKDILETLVEKFSWVVVESGRGVPPEICKGRYKFLPFSLVDSYLNGRTVSKLGLSQSILELTRLN